MAMYTCTCINIKHKLPPSVAQVPTVGCNAVRQVGSLDLSVRVDGTIAQHINLKRTSMGMASMVIVGS